MIQLFPFAAWIALLTSVGFLIMLWTAGELAPGLGAVLVGCLLAAGYCQFFGPSVVVSAIGLVLQTLLAVYLIVRWKLTE
jgi:hypothetical protein